jgi:hypothetical protein
LDLIIFGFAFILINAYPLIQNPAEIIVAFGA